MWPSREDGAMSRGFLLGYSKELAIGGVDKS